MGDQNRRQARDALEAVGEHPGVEQQRGLGRRRRNVASRQEWPKCVNCMRSIVRRDATLSVSWPRRGWSVTRMLAAVGVAAMAAAFSLLGQPIAHADPDTCPPNCDRIPATAWIDPAAIPLAAKYHWPDLAGIAVPRCTTAVPLRGGVRDARGCPTTRGLMRWRPRPPSPIRPASGSCRFRCCTGAASRGTAGSSPTRSSALGDRPRCGRVRCTAPQASPSLTTDEPGRLAAVLSVAGDAPTVLHQYLVAHPQSGTVVELAMWASSPPAEDWPVVLDYPAARRAGGAAVRAYIASCR